MKAVIAECLASRTPGRTYSQTQTTMVKKKRLRRQKFELERLRQEAARMEAELLRLQELKMKYPHNFCEPCSSFVPVTNVTKTFRPIKPRKIQKYFMWKEIAEREFKERWRAQNQNRKLRERLVRKYELGRHMQELLLRLQLLKHYDSLGNNYSLTSEPMKTSSRSSYFKHIMRLLEWIKCFKNKYLTLLAALLLEHHSSRTSMEMSLLCSRTLSCHLSRQLSARHSGVCSAPKNRGAL